MYNRETIETTIFRLGYGIVFLFFTIPLLVVIGTSFDQSGAVIFPPGDITLAWYHAFATDGRWLAATRNSLIIATGTTILSTLIGVSTALGVRNLTVELRSGVILLVVLPLLVPPVVIAVTLLMFFSQFGMQHTYIGIILAHSLWATPIVFAIMYATFQRYDWQIREAALDLGASPTRSFISAVVPSVKNGLFAGILISFVISLQEFVMALFLSGAGTQTIPVLAWVSLRRELSPLVSVVSTLLLLSVVLIVMAASLGVGLQRLAKNL